MTNRIFGIVVGIVKDVADPEGQGRILLDLEFMPGKHETHWAPVATPMAGLDRGYWVMPEVGDEAVVAFDHGDPDHPYVLGFTWNGKDKPPSTTNKERIIRSFNGHTIRMLDSTPDAGNKGALTIEDAHGNCLVMTNTHVTLHSKGVLVLDGMTIVLQGPGYKRVITPNSNPI